MPRERIVPIGMRRSDSGSVRRLFASEEVGKLFAGGEAAKAAGFPDIKAQTLIDAFISGTRLNVSLVGGPSHADFKRLKGVDEAWLMCFRMVRGNHWRVLGRFSRRDLFIGLMINPRGDFEDGKYAEHGRKMVERWNAAFRNAEPLRGTKVSDYLSNARDIDDEF